MFCCTTFHHGKYRDLDDLADLDDLDDIYCLDDLPIKRDVSDA